MVGKELANARPIPAIHGIDFAVDERTGTRHAKQQVLLPLVKKIGNDIGVLILNVEGALSHVAKENPDSFDRLLARIDAQLKSGPRIKTRVLGDLVLGSIDFD
jgi:hypothetical protein